MLRKINNCFLATLLLSSSVKAQFHHKCTIQPVSQDGFYSIPVSPDLSIYSKVNLTDLRIADKKGMWIPHILTTWDKNHVTDIIDWELPITKLKNSNDETVIIIRKDFKTKISNFLLQVKNAKVNRFASISGSDNNQDWFSITDSLLLKNPDPTLENNFALRVYFPPVDYRYFRIKIYNGNHDPFQIQKVLTEGAGSIITFEQKIRNPKSIFSQTDSAGYSLIKIEQPNNFQFSTLNLSVTYPKYFERDVSFYLEYQGSIGQLLSTTPLQRLTVSTNSSGDYNLPLIKSKIFYLLVRNNDNPPLHFSEIQTKQPRRNLVAWLENGNNYQLYFDDSTATAPDYDLKKFKEKIPDSLTSLSIGNIEVINLPPVVKARNPNWWIWPAIIIVLVLLSFSTLALTRDLKKQNNQPG